MEQFPHLFEVYTNFELEMIGQECLSSTHLNTLLMYRSFLQPEVCNRAAKHPLVGIRECETTMTRSLLSRNKNTCPRKNLV